MPINPNIPEAFIAAYAHFYQPKVIEPSFTDTAATLFKATTYAMVGKMTPDEKAKSCKDIISLFKANLSVDEWMELTYTLGEKARVHQTDKNIATRSIAPSHLSEALHAARSYIVSCLAADPDYQLVYQNTLRSLSTQLNEKDQLITKNRRSTNIDVRSLVNDRDMLLVKLAYLGDEAALNRCIDHHLFDYMPRLNNDPANAPFFMQTNYFSVLYNDKLKNKLNEDLHCFIKKATERDLPFPLTSHESANHAKSIMAKAPEKKQEQTPAPTLALPLSTSTTPTSSPTPSPQSSLPPIQTNIDQVFTHFSLPLNMVSSDGPFGQAEGAASAEQPALNQSNRPF